MELKVGDVIRHSDGFSVIVPDRNEPDKYLASAKEGCITRGIKIDLSRMHPVTYILLEQFSNGVHCNYPELNAKEVLFNIFNNPMDTPKLCDHKWKDSYEKRGKQWCCLCGEYK